jgi:hypothetical protein
MKHLIVFIYFVVSLLVALTGLASGEEAFVGAYYYPWYGAHSTLESLRSHLVPAQYPAQGNYNSKSEALISAHIDYSIRGNIIFWSVSWWGPYSYEDDAFKNYILTHPRAAELKYAILYESTGRLGEFSNPNYSTLIPDFDYLAEHYFDDANYLKIDSKAVVFIYLTRVYFTGTAAADAALAALRQAHPNLYLIGDHVWNGCSSEAAEQWEAVTAYDVYGQSLQPYGSTMNAINRLVLTYDTAKTNANSVGTGLVPCATPGFNDRVIRDGHEGAPRYLEDDVHSVEGDLFRTMLKEAVIPKVDPLAENMLMITSFNEWHEDTQIEPTLAVSGHTDLDNSGTGTDYTQGDYYWDYGNLYLDILRQETGEYGCGIIDLNKDGRVDLEDCCLIGAAWKSSPGEDSWNEDCDLVPDEIIDVNDLSVLAENWLKGIVPFAHWRLDGDYTDNAGIYDGTPLGDPVLVTGDVKVGTGAVELDGDDMVKMIGCKGIPYSLPRTCTAWVKTTTAPGNIIWWGKNDVPGGMWDMKIGSNSFLRVRVDGGFICGSTQINTGQWIHVVAVLPPGGTSTEDILLYVNGELEEGTTSKAHYVDTATHVNLRIGSDNSGNFLTGLLDDVRVYDRALSSDEIADLAN